MEPTAQPQPDDSTGHLRDLYVWIPPRKTDPDASGTYVRAAALTEQDRADLVRAAMTDTALGIDEIRETLRHGSIDTLLAYVRRGNPFDTERS